MRININQFVSLTEAKQNFGRAAKIADQTGTAVICEENCPKYLIVNLHENPPIKLSDDEKIEDVTKRILNKFHADFNVIAK